jgi:hypothetical protein
MQISSELITRILQTTQAKEYLERKYKVYSGTSYPSAYTKARHIEYNREWTPAHSSERYRWVEHVSRGLRMVGTSYDIRREAGHYKAEQGWYTDSFQDETTEGIVYQLPTKDGKSRFIPANSDPRNEDCAVVDFHAITDDKVEAARWANQMAERYAEDARNAEMKDRVEQRLADIKDETVSLYKEYRATVRALRADKVINAPSVCKLIRAEWQSVRSQIEKLRTEARKLETDGYID